MKLRHAMISLLVALAAGCDTMEQDADGQMLTINNEPAYLLRGTDGIIDLAGRIVSPGKITVEITGPTRNGSLTDLGEGLLQYSPSKVSDNDSFRFRVFSADNNIIGEDSIGIIMPTDTTSLPCAVYSRNDTVSNVTGPVIVDVAANDYACLVPLTISVNGQPDHGTVSIVDNKIQYVPGSTFDGFDQILYKAVASDPSMHEGWGLLRIIGTDSLLSCHPVTVDDILFLTSGDTTTAYLDVLQNDSLCNDSTIMITRHSHYGSEFFDNSRKKIGYKNIINPSHDDTLFYQVSTSSQTRVIIKRQ